MSYDKETTFLYILFRYAKTILDRSKEQETNAKQYHRNLNRICLLISTIKLFGLNYTGT